MAVIHFDTQGELNTLVKRIREGKFKIRETAPKYTASFDASRMLSSWSVNKRRALDPQDTPQPSLYHRMHNPHLPSRVLIILGPPDSPVMDPNALKKLWRDHRIYTGHFRILVTDGEPQGSVGPIQRCIEWSFCDWVHQARLAYSVLQRCDGISVTYGLDPCTLPDESELPATKSSETNTAQLVTQGQADMQRKQLRAGIRPRDKTLAKNSIPTRSYTLPNDHVHSREGTLAQRSTLPRVNIGSPEHVTPTERDTQAANPQPGTNPLPKDTAPRSHHVTQGRDPSAKTPPIGATTQPGLDALARTVYGAAKQAAEEGILLRRKPTKRVIKPVTTPLPPGTALVSSTSAPTPKAVTAPLAPENALVMSTNAPAINMSMPAP